MITKLHHVAVLTRKMENAIQYYMQMLGCPAPGIVQIDKPGVRFRTAMLQVGPNSETYVQLIEPAEGPGVEDLERGGEGTIFEIGFEVDDIREFHDCMVGQGIEPVDFAEQRFSGKYIVASSGNRYLFLPRAKTRGTRTEIVQVTRRGR